MHAAVLVPQDPLLDEEHEMFRSNVLRSVTVVLALTAMTGCQGKYRTAVTRDMERMDETLAAPRAYLTNGVDNAILHDMSLADFHFVPHSTELSGSGVARLDRMAILLDTYGGVVRYEAATTDERLIEGRLDHVKEYLSLVGCSMEKIALATAVSGGRGGPAEKAVNDENTALESLENVSAPSMISSLSGS